MMSENVELFWDALGKLTFAETLVVAETMRDAREAFGDFDQASAFDWSCVLNSAREIATDISEDAE